MYTRDFDLLDTCKDPHTLSVLLHEDSIYCALFSSENVMYSHKSFQSLTFHSDENREEVVSNVLFSYPYQKVAINVMGCKSFHLPQAEPSLGDYILSLSTKKLYIEKMAANEAVTHFGLTRDQQSWIENIAAGKSMTIHHFSNVLALNYLQKPGNIIHVHIEQDHIYIYVQRDGLFCAYRRVDVQGVEDILYFVLAFYHEFHLNPAQDMLTISGWLDANSALFTKIYGFVAKVSWVENVEFSLSNGKPSELRDHYYFAHFVNCLCAS